MTRINIIEPEMLTYEHLLAEYRELPRVFTHILKAVESGKSLKDYDIPEKYTIGKGHVTFFYNKAGWLKLRWVVIVNILIAKYSCNLDQEYIIKVNNDFDNLPEWAKADRGIYKPTTEELYLNMYRLSNRHFFKLEHDHYDKEVLEVYNK